MSAIDALRAPQPARLPPADVAPTMSVLVPAFNAADTIGEALESVLSQRPAPREVIVSDDGSEDDIDAALREFRQRIEVVRGPNAGLATARNRAAAVARGDLLGLLDADDVWLPGRAAAIVEAARLRPDLDIITTDAYVARGGRRDRDTYYTVREWPAGDQIDAILRASFIFGAAGIRRDAFERVGGYDADVRFAEDWDLWLRLLVAGSRAGLVPEPLYEYRRRAESLTGRRVDLAVGVVQVLARARALPLDRSRRRVLRETEATWRLEAAMRAVAMADPRRARLAARALVTPGVPVSGRLRLLVRLSGR